MSGSRSTSSSENTLYDPPDGEAEAVPDEEGEVELELDVPPELAERLHEVATHLGLSPAMVATRAVEMVCDEVGLVQDTDLSSTTLIQKYQTRLDLLHSLDYSLEPPADEIEEAAPEQAAADEEMGIDDPDEYDWGDVDSIIGRVTDPSDQESRG